MANCFFWNFVSWYVFDASGLLEVRRYSSADLRTLRSRNDRRHVVTNDVVERVGLLDLRRTCRRRGKRGGRRQRCCGKPRPRQPLPGDVDACLPARDRRPIPSIITVRDNRHRQRSRSRPRRTCKCLRVQCAIPTRAIPTRAIQKSSPPKTFCSIVSPDEPNPNPNPNPNPCRNSASE